MSLYPQVSPHAFQDTGKIIAIHGGRKIFPPLPCFAVEAIQSLKGHGINHIALCPNLNVCFLYRVWVMNQLYMPRLYRLWWRGGNRDNRTKPIRMTERRRNHHDRAQLDHFRDNKASEITAQNLPLFGIKETMKRHKQTFQAKQRPRNGGLIKKHPARLANRFTGRPYRPGGIWISTDRTIGNAPILHALPVQKQQRNRYQRLSVTTVSTVTEMITRARESRFATPFVPLDTSATTAHHARAAATSVAGRGNPNLQRQTGRIHAVFVCLHSPFAVMGGRGREAHACWFRCSQFPTRPLPLAHAWKHRRASLPQRKG